MGLGEIVSTVCTIVCVCVCVCTYVCVCTRGRASQCFIQRYPTDNVSIIDLIIFVHDAHHQQCSLLL